MTSSKKRPASATHAWPKPKEAKTDKPDESEGEQVEKETREKKPYEKEGDAKESDAKPEKDEDAKEEEPEDDKSAKGKDETKKKQTKAAKGKAKAKVKSKALAKPKPKAKNKGKPHKDENKNKGNKDVKEEPKKEDLLSKTEKWAHGCLEEKGEGVAASEEEEEHGDKRSRGKAKKFKKMQDAGAIPDHIMELFSGEAAKAGGRKYKTDLINKLFKENGKGGWEMDATAPWFEASKTAYHKKFGKEENIGTPRDVFLFQSFMGNEAALDKAIENGSVQQWDEAGILYCGYRKTTAGIEKSKRESVKTGGGSVDLNQEQYKLMGKAFKTMSWSFGDLTIQDDSGERSSSSSNVKKQKSLENVGLTKPMIDLITDAKGSQDKLHASAMKLLNKCSSLADKQEFKATALALKDFSHKNEHVLTWKDLLPSDSKGCFLFTICNMSLNNIFVCNLCLSSSSLNNISLGSIFLSNMHLGNICLEIHVGHLSL